MKAPVSWLRELVELPAHVTTEQIADRLTQAGLQVERIERPGAQVTGPVVVGRVVEVVAEPQKNGKTIYWCHVDVGDHNPEGQSSRGVVCGAPNVVPGAFVPVALPGAVLPGGFEITPRKTYGHISDGMICAADELGLGEDHTGIIVLAADPEPIIGADALDLLGVRDEIMDIDVTPDTAHGLSIRGLAREMAQAFGVPFTDPYSSAVPAVANGGYPVLLESEDCSLFVALTVTGVDPNAASPTWMARRLEASGMRSISLAVDITNYIMLESGQPLHAYDGDTLRGPIVVRNARAGETLTTLDGNKRPLSTEDLLITDDSGPIGLAGVMGGLDTELSPSTTTIVLEGAHFLPTTIGRTFRRHKLASEASRRFERGVDVALPYAATLRAARLLEDLAGGSLQEALTVAGSVLSMPVQTMPVDLPSKILGATVSRDRVVEVLTTAGVTIEGDEVLTLTPPTWRPDLVDSYDYVEEVGRKIGFDAIGYAIPHAPVGFGYTIEQTRRRALISAVAAAGFVELLMLPFLGADDIDRLGLPTDDPRRALVRLANPLDDTRPFLRTTLLPGLCQAVARNTSRSLTDLALFECGAVFRAGDQGPAPMPDASDRPSQDVLDELYASLPEQPRMLAGILCGDWHAAGWQGPAVAADWTHAVLLAEVAAKAVGVELVRQAGELAPWHPGRCALLSVRRKGLLSTIGAAGELHPQVCRANGLPPRTCAIELDLDALLAGDRAETEVGSLSAFPLTKQDVALTVDESVPAKAVEQALREGAGPLLEAIALFDIYTGPQIGAGKKSLAYSLHFRGADKTLTEKDAGAARNAAVAMAAQRVGAVQRA